VPEISAEVAARDAEIFAAAEELREELGKDPTRRALGAYVAQTTGQPCTAGRVSQAYRRKREAEGDSSPGIGGRKRTPLVDLVVLLCEGAIEVARDFEGLPKVVFARPAARLRRRKGWQDQLRKLAAATVRPSAEPEQLELELDVVGTLEQQIHELKAVIAATERPADARQDRQTLLAYIDKLEKHRPSDEVKDAIPRGQIPEEAHSARTKLRQLGSRLRDLRDEKVAALLEEARERGEVEHSTAVWLLRALGDLPGKEERDDDCY
jgi:hypothetical protein